MKFTSVSFLIFSSLLSAWCVASAEIASVEFMEFETVDVESVDGELVDNRQLLHEGDQQKRVTKDTVDGPHESIMSEADLLTIFLEASDEELEFLLEPEAESITGKGWF